MQNNTEDNLGLFRLSFLEDSSPKTLDLTQLGKFKVENLLGDAGIMLVEGDDENSIIIGVGGRNSVELLGALFQLLGVKRGPTK